MPTPAERAASTEQRATEQTRAHREVRLQRVPGPFVAEVPPPFVPTTAHLRRIGRFRQHYLRRVVAVLVVLLLVAACAVVLVRLREGEPVDAPSPATSSSASAS